MASDQAGVPRKKVPPILCWLGRALFPRRRVPVIPRGTALRVLLDRWRAGDRHFSNTCQSVSDSNRPPDAAASEGEAPVGFQGQRFWNRLLPVWTTPTVTHRNTRSLAGGTGSQVCLRTSSLTRTDPTSDFTLSHTEILVSAAYGVGGERLLKLGLRLIIKYLKETIVICDLFTGLWRAKLI